jgi:phosphatidate cytidylyltransferase
LLRIVTAIVLIALLAASLSFTEQPLVFVAVMILSLILAWREFAGLAAEAGAAPLRGLGMLLAVACAAAFALPYPGAPIAALGAAAVISTVAGLAAGQKHPALAVRRVVATIGGCVWLGLMPGFQIGLRYRENGVVWLVFLYVAVSAGDIFAFYGGSFLGRHPLSPSLSPKKTIEGTVFGLAASTIGAALVGYYWLPELGLVRAGLLGLLLGVVGQAGDLFESSLKRAAKTKDSSTLLPGHGGIMDRIDGLLFGGATLYVVLFLLDIS